MATGTAPFHRLSKEFASKMTAHQAAEIPRVGAVRDDAPPELDRVVARLLAKRPGERYSSSEDLLNDLTPLAKRADLRGLASRLGLPHQPRAAPKGSAAIGQADGRRKISRRLLLGSGAAAAVAALPAVYGHDMWRKASSLRTGQWRPLAALAPRVLYSLDDDATINDDPQRRSIAVSSSAYVLINLGQPVSGVFTLRTSWTPEPGSRAGVFFRYRERVEQGQIVREFHALEFSPSEETNGGRGDLRWRHVLVRDLPESPKVLEKLWAATTLAATDTREPVELEVTLGSHGFPVIMFNGEPLPEPDWRLTSAGRHKSRISEHLWRTDYLGRLGLAVASGSATFFQPELMYHDVPEV
jgi:hypothetical protein